MSDFGLWNAECGMPGAKVALRIAKKRQYWHSILITQLIAAYTHEGFSFERRFLLCRCH